MTLPATATIVGSGTMGPGIAATLKRAGIEVRVYDISNEALTRAETATTSAETVLSSLDRPAATDGSVAFLTDFSEALTGTDFVIEAVPEDPELKKTVLRDIEAVVGSDVLISTNTSGIPISTMAQSMSRPERFIGMHWSNPPHLIPMIEVIPGGDTEEQVTSRLTDIVTSVGYHPVREKEVAGFVENRVLYAIMRECLALVQDGVVTQEALDTCVKWGIGYKLAVLGPMRLLDMAGLDIYKSVSGYLNQQLDAASDTPDIASNLVAQNKLGFKTEDGMYSYGPGDVDTIRANIVQGLVAVQKALNTTPAV